MRQTSGSDRILGLNKETSMGLQKRETLKKRWIFITSVGILALMLFAQVLWVHSSFAMRFDTIHAFHR